MDEQVIISSAVIIPEAGTAATSPSSPYKRRQALTSTTESSNKRPRLSTDNGSSPEPASGQPNATDRVSRETVVEERKRGQRLFGGLLNTLAQRSSSSSQNRRRTDIERKQQAKLKNQAEEYDDNKKKDLERILALRQKAQRKFDGETLRIRHSNLRAMANFLRTSTEPRLYYKPWKLTSDEKTRIKTQIEDTNVIISREQEEYRSQLPDDERQEADQEEELVQQADGHASHEQVDVSSKLDTADTVGSGALDATTNTETTDVSTNQSTTAAPDIAETDVRMATEDHDGGEVVLEADEDTVIY